MNDEKLLDGLNKAVKMSNAIVRVTHAIQHYEAGGEYCIGTDTLRYILSYGIIETTTPKDYNRDEFIEFMNGFDSNII